MAEAIAFDIAKELITKLSSPALSQIGLWWNLKDDIDGLKSTVCTIKAGLLDAEERSVTDNLVKDWLEKLKDVLYHADDLLDDFSAEALRKNLVSGNELTKKVHLFFSSSNQFAYSLKMGRKIKAIKARLASIESEFNTFRFMVRDRPAETSFMTKKRQETHSFEREDEIIGRDDDKAALLKLVLEFQSEENVYIVPIMGLGGLGKTALAQLVYNDEMVKNHFELTMFACVSDVFDVKIINEQQWAKGSRIIVTTRSLRVAKIANRCESHVLKLKGLSDDDAWSLFKKIAFDQRYADSTNSAFVEVGKQISKRCGGIPLVIRVIAREILPTLKLSYDHLSSHLKDCFSFCRLYPKDYEIDVQELVQFWIAQELAEKCFFQEVKGDLTEEITCKMHDLMHDLAKLVAGTESSTVDSNLSTSEGKKLRTLLYFSNMGSQNLSDEIWDLIIANCRCLLILLKSICRIQNLQSLKLDLCLELEELPKKIEKLVNLTHIGCEGCISLTRMPRGIGKLSSLETLSMFVVDKDGFHGSADLSELSALNNLRGELTITNLGLVKNWKEMFRAANLKEKKHLRSLVLEWNDDDDDDDDDNDKLLEDLQPHPNLKELCINGWRGDAKFPSWLSLLTNLLDIFYLIELEQGNTEPFFPLLKVLKIWRCPNMKSWWRATEAIGDDSNEDDTTVIGTSTMAFPCLSSLEIEDCPLTSMPLYPSLDNELKLVKTSSRALKQTLKMNITSITPSGSISSIPLSKLKSFHVDYIEGLDTHMLDKSLQHFTGLKKLTIGDCKEVDFVGMQWELLTNLSHLEINNNPQLLSLPFWLQHLVQLKGLIVGDCKEVDLEGMQWEALKNLSRLEIKNIPKLVSLPIGL
ncbi:hypothetical protein ES332_A11G380400v1 [Gossypium tomentosum]|uniref:Rx N-terminal domain-containing protein n=1 Tax=Gossypium tomentosum TaxID=34277 RepID=A0A5D2NJ83_GOSTO|nr:hypothetical protein ES332_A11G380400v1 [Gossypium tomentosum]